MIHPDVELRRVDDVVGYGVFATRRIPRGTIVWQRCALGRLWTPAEYAALDPVCRQAADVYAYRAPSGDHAMEWDFARFMNHSCRPNVLTVIVGVDLAVDDIEPDDQITCDYGTLNVNGVLRCC